MRTGFLVAIAVLGLAGIGVAAAQMGGMGYGHGMGYGRGYGMGPGMMGSARHVYYMHNGLPAPYAGRRNPLPMSRAVLAEGRKLYASDCAACHGANGRGDGPAAQGLNPPPADLGFTMSMPVAQDDFLYWTIAEGGAPFGSAMPAFKTTLKPNQIWSLVTALRSGDLQAGK